MSFGPCRESSKMGSVLSKTAPEQVKEFWDSRAREFGPEAAATLTDEYLRALEIRTMTRYLRRLKPRRVADVGCGNGYSTVKFAETFPEIQFVGIDYSEEMIEFARPRERANCTFVRGD